MSIRPLIVNADGSVVAYYDETGHEGVVPVTAVEWATNNGEPTHGILALPCPDGCGDISYHPVSGGSAPLEVQEMFTTKIFVEGCCCGDIQKQDVHSIAEAHVRLGVCRMDGYEQWQATDTPSLKLWRSADQTDTSPGFFQVVYHRQDNRIIGIFDPGDSHDDFSQQDQVAEFTDRVEYDNLLKYRPAWVSADGLHIVGEQP